MYCIHITYYILYTNNIYIYIYICKMLFATTEVDLMSSFTKH